MKNDQNIVDFLKATIATTIATKTTTKTINIQKSDAKI